MQALITGDLHLTDNPADEYRWEVFDWIRSRVQIMNLDAVFILGDITDRKDRHSAALVNRIMEEMEGIASACDLYVLKGNHDYDADDGVPFFKFARWFYTEPEVVTVGKTEILLLPHVRGKFKYRRLVQPGYDLIFLHQTLEGSLVSNGAKMEGLKLGTFSKKRIGNAVVVSGDIHVPQRLGNVTYAGAPYPVHFGDTYDPRVLIWKDGKLVSFPRTTIRKIQATLDLRSTKTPMADRIKRGLKASAAESGDHVRLQCRLRRKEIPHWSDIQAEILHTCDKRGLVVHGLGLHDEALSEVVADEEGKRGTGSSEDTFTSFCESTNVPAPLQRVGRRML